MERVQTGFHLKAKVELTCDFETLLAQLKSWLVAISYADKAQVIVDREPDLSELDMSHVVKDVLILSALVVESL